MSRQDQTVFIVDDDDSVRDAISMLLESMDVAHKSFGDAQAFLDSNPGATGGVAVLDIRMPGMSGLELQDKLNEAGSALPIIFITGHGDIPMAVEAMKKGAVEFIRKPFRDQELLDSINAALNAEESQRQSSLDLQEIRKHAQTLTPRETEVFQRIAEGQANKVVAIELDISERTVEIHRSQVMKKMGVRSLAALVRCKMALEQAGT